MQFFRYMPVIFAFSALLLGALHATADDSDAELKSDLSLSYERSLARTHISLGVEGTNLTSKTSSVVGIGPRFGAEYGLSEKFSIAANASFAFEATGQPGSFFYSGLYGAIRYSIIGTSVLSTVHVRKSDGTEVYTSTPSANRRLALSTGFEQLFLNGTTSIYPAAGVHVGGVYTFALFQHEGQIDVRYSSLYANDNPISMIGIGMTLNLTL